MATAITQNTKLTRGSVIHIILSLACLAAVLMIVIADTEVLKSSVQDELFVTKEALDEDSWVLIEDRARIRYRENFFDNGFFESVQDVFLGDEEIFSEAIKSEDGIMEKALDNFVIFSYQVFFRLTVLEYWVMLLAPICIGLIAQGYFEWRIKAYRMGGVSTGGARIWMKLIWSVFFSFVLMLVLPASVVSITVYMPAMFLFVLALAISRYIANYAKSF